MDDGKRKTANPQSPSNMSTTMDNYDLKETLSENKIRGLWRMMTGYHKIYLLATIAVGIAAVARAGTSYLIGFFVDSVLPSPNVLSLLPWVAASFIGLALIQGSFTFLGGRMAARTAEGITQRLRNYIYDQLQRLSFTYHDRMQTGELLSRSTSDVDTLRRLFADQLIGIGRIGLLFIISFLALVYLNLELALYSVVIIPVVIGMSIFFFRKMEVAYEVYQS
ncbi:hypothetical protein GC175_31280 [bacterium]|nr:hypothetical protein [bacterium]